MKRYDLMHGINTRGTFLVSKTCIPHLKKAANPHVLNLSPPLNMETKWFAPHVAYTMAKFGMSMCVLGMAGEYKSAGIAFNALWPRTVIATAAVQNLLGGDAIDEGVAQAGDPRRRGVRDLQQAGARVHRQLLHRRRGAEGGGQDRSRRVRIDAGRDHLPPGLLRMKKAPKKSAAKKPAAKKPVAKTVAKKQVAKKPAAKAKPVAKPAAKPVEKAKPVKPVGVRGVALVEQAIANSRAKNHDVRPLVAKVIAGLRMPDGSAIPASLATWLAYDNRHLDAVDNNRMAWKSFIDLMEETYGEAESIVLAPFARFFPGQCLLLPGGSDSRRFMYAGVPDSAGEYPVYATDLDDVPWVGLAFPGFDVFIAHAYGVPIATTGYAVQLTGPYGDALREQARLNSGGALEHELGSEDFEAVVEGVD